MASIPTGPGFLTVTVGAFTRRTYVTREGAYRVIQVSNCPVTHWTVMGSGDGKLDGHSFHTDGLLNTVTIMEVKPGEFGRRFAADPEKIGTLNTNYMHADVYVPDDALALFWAAAEATDGSTRSMELILKPDRQDELTVTNINLFESMPRSPFHPVVAELRIMREKLFGKTRPIIVAFWIVVAIWVLSKIFR